MAGHSSLVRRYYAYYVTNAYGFYLPVSVVYLTQHLGFSLGQVGAIKASFMVALTLAEVPTGYVGDRVGRRATLALGSVLSAAGLVAYAVADTPLEFVVLNVVWATGWGFRSGTTDAWLYELLAARGDSDEYARVKGRASTFLLVVSAGSALAAGPLATIDWTVPFLANAALAAAGVPLLFTLPPSETSDVAAGDADDAPDADPAPFTARDATRLLRLQSTRPEIRWFVAYVGLFYVLFQATRVFEQPAAVAVGVPVSALGALYAGFKLLSAGVAASAGRVRDAVGTRAALGLLAPVLGLAFAATAVAPVLVVPVLFLNRSAHRLVVPLRNQYLNDRLDDVGRATVLSGVSMLLSIAAAVNNVVAGQLANVTGAVDVLAVLGAGFLVLAAILWFGASPVHDPVETPGADPDAATTD